MKTLLIFLLLTSAAWAQEEACGVFTVKGVVSAKEGFHLILNKGSMSEKRLVIPEKFLMRIAPYIKIAIRAEVIIAGRNPQSGDEILDIVNIDYDMPDPLNPVGSLKYIKPSVCP
jgi:hypothetical protein